MIIGTSRTLGLGCVPDININIYHSVLPSLLKYDYLGVTVKSTLSWDLYILKVCSKLSQRVGLLGHLLNSVPNEMWKIKYIKYRLSNMCSDNNRLLYYCLGLCTSYINT